MKRVSFKTIGCRLNKAETAKIRSNFVAAGYEVVPFKDDTDVCIIHTCTITGMAEKECIRLARGVKSRNPSAFVVMAGCAAEIEQNLNAKYHLDYLNCFKHLKYDLENYFDKVVLE